MIIDEIKYALSEQNYIQVECIKTQIVITNTFNHDMRHVIGWKNRNNGKYKKTAAFTIDAAGLVYKHFDPKYMSKFFGTLELDTKSIVIQLENDGWLLKDKEKNRFITWIGDIYNKSNEVVEKRWRGYDYWAPYTTEQFDSTIELVKQLCNEFYIPITAIGHNTKIDALFGYQGVLYKSNIEKHYTDLTPAWDFNRFKEMIENK